MVVILRFIDREEEISLLKEFWENPNAKFLVIYGRRRIGKSRLVQEFLKTLPDVQYVYFLASKRPIISNLEKFSRRLSEKLGLPKLLFGNFIDAFRFLARIFKDKQFLVVIDEFGYLVEQDPGILSDFQEIVDLILPNSKLKLIVLGSIVSLMESRVTGYKSPLYGRAYKILKITPLKFQSLFEWFSRISVEDAIKIYAVTNAVPKYLEFFSGKNIEEEIVKNFFDSSSFLFNDAIELLREELRDPTTYILILEAIAHGYNKITEIANYTYSEPPKITPYIRTLMNMGIVKRELPIFAKKKEKRGRYFITDNYFRFWFRFISPFYEEIESGLSNEAINMFRKNFNTYLGEIFEELVRKEIISFLRRNGINPSKVGKWWKKDIDIDLVVVDDTNKLILFGEIKWKDITMKDVYKLVGKLEEISRYFPHKKNYMKKFCIIAKSIKRKEYTSEILIADLNDIFLQSKPI